VTLNRTSAPAISSKPDLRTTGKQLRLPVILLALVAAIPFADFSAPQNANAASVPAAVPAPAPQAVTVPAEATVSEAVTTPAVETPKAVTAQITTAFASRADGLSPQVLRMALDAMAAARARGISGRDDLLTVIDYSLPSTQPRLWVLDLANGKVLFHELVAHGSGSGDNYATRFSNNNDSHQTSLGLFLTGGTYEGGNGYSLKLRGLDKGFNDRAEERHIVMHGAWYVSAEHARAQGRLGRSWGCPALSQQSAGPVIDTIKGGSFVFSYASADPAWLRAATATLQQTAATLAGTTATAASR
jgi:hypothetical protein